MSASLVSASTTTAILKIHAFRVVRAKLALMGRVLSAVPVCTPTPITRNAWNAGTGKTLRFTTLAWLAMRMVTSAWTVFAKGVHQEEHRELRRLITATMRTPTAYFAR